MYEKQLEELNRFHLECVALKNECEKLEEAVNELERKLIQEHESLFGFDATRKALNAHVREIGV